MLDGDWTAWQGCKWDYKNPKNDEMQIQNIGFILNNFLKNESFKSVIFTWVLAWPSVREKIFDKIKSSNFKLFDISLICNEEVLYDRMLKREIFDYPKLTVKECEAQIAGLFCRSQKIIGNYENFNTIKIDVSDLSKEEVCNKIFNIINSGWSFIKIAFFDRDGTIIKDYPDAEWGSIKKPEFINGAFEALRHVLNRGYRIIIVTNQYLIGEKIISQKDYEEFSELFLDELKCENIKILDIFYCPHARSDNCSCCKPKPGLIRKALEKYPYIEMKNSFLVGDSVCDMKLAEFYGLKLYGIGLNCENNINTVKDLLSYSI